MTRLRLYLKYLNSLPPAKILEILECDKMDVRRIIPLKRQLLGHGKTSEKTKCHTDSIRRKVRERNNRLISHAQSLVEKPPRILDDLKRLRAYCHIVMAVRHERQPLVSILPKKSIAIRNSLLELGDADVHAISGYVPVLLENIEQSSVAAANVDYVRIILDHRQNRTMLLFLCMCDVWLSVTEETADQTGQVIYMGEECVMPGAYVKMAVCDRLVAAKKRFNYVTRLPVRKQDISGKRHDKRLARNTGTCGV